MRAADWRRATETLPLADFETLAPPGGLLIVAPHQDDESLGCGGLIAQARAQSRAVRIVFVSDGVGSHPNSRTHPLGLLRRLRREEAIAAAGVLGLAPRDCLFLDLPDGRVPSEGAVAKSAMLTIAQAADDIAAGAVFVTAPSDPHCDHQAAFLLARRAAALARGRPRLRTYPIWSWRLPDEAEIEAPLGWRLDISAHLALKQAAIAAHRSQTTNLIADDPGGFRLSDDDLACFRTPFETFLEADV